MRHRFASLVLTLAAGGGLVAPGLAPALARETQPAPPAAPGLVVSTTWLAAHLDDPNVAVITTGTRAVYDAAHIPGARFVEHDATLDGQHGLLAPAPLAAALARAGAAEGRRVVLYGDSPMATGWLYMAFALIGHGGSVSMLDGSLALWQSEGRRTATTEPPAATGRLSPKPADDVGVDAAWVRARLEDPAIKLLDVRTDQEWRRGRLPGATLVLWQDLFADQAMQRFKSPEEIRAILSRAGVKPGQQAVTYCAVGMRASLMYFAAMYAGVPVRVYTGSFEDWQQQPGYPIVR
jgi:thiosulfate/3-mercaptopyruvate sulfurtransferase